MKRVKVLSTAVATVAAMMVFAAPVMAAPSMGGNIGGGNVDCDDDVSDFSGFGCDGDIDLGD